MSADVAVESLPERLAREAARSVDVMNVEDERTREGEIARVCVIAIRSGLYEAITIALRMGHQDVAEAIEALK